MHPLQSCKKKKKVFNSKADIKILRNYILQFCLVMHGS